MERENRMRWRYGDTNPVVAPTFIDDEIFIGEFLFLVDGLARPYQKGYVKRDFLGVSMQCKKKGETPNIRTATTGIFEFPSDEKVEPILGSMFTIIAENMVSPCVSPQFCIGRLDSINTNGTEYLIRIKSRIYD